MIEQMKEAVAAPENAEAANATPNAEHVDSVPKPKVNDLVRDAKKEAYDRGRRDALAENALSTQGMPQTPQPEMQQPVPQPPVQPQVQQPAMVAQPQPMGQPVGMGGMPQMSPADIQQMIRQEAQNLMQQHQQQNAWQQTVNQFVGKVNAGPQKYADFESVVAPLQLDKNPHLVHLTNLVDNTVDVLHDLGNNGPKVAILNELARTNPQMAVREIQNLSNSIKANEMATKSANPNEPLSQVKPSTVTTDGGSPLTIGELRKKDYLRA